MSTTAADLKPKPSASKATTSLGKVRKKKLRNKRRNAQRALDTRAVLVERFPHCFAGKGHPKQPLAVNIDIDVRLACPDLDRARIELALRDYTRGPTYLRSFVVGAARITLDGSVKGVVDQAAADLATTKLARLLGRTPAPSAAQPIAA